MVNRKPVIVVIEDDPHIRSVLCTSLQAYGYEVPAAASAREGLTLTGDHRPELVILDLGLPDIDGLDLIASLRGLAAQEILVLSARSGEEEKVRALDLGADDFLAKPFGLFELLARVRVALRRASLAAKPQEDTMELRSAGVAVDFSRRQVTRSGQEIHLTPIEYRLFATLARHGGKILTHEQLLTAVWGPAQDANTQYLRIYLGGLRRKLEADPARPKLLLTIPGIGYRLAMDRSAVEDART